MRNLTDQEKADTIERLLVALESIDERTEAKKAAASAFNEEIKALREQIGTFREMLRTGKAQPEQLSLVSGGKGVVANMADIAD